MTTDDATVRGHTPWQTVGPFFHFALPWTEGGVLTRPETLGERIVITGLVTDGTGAPVPDALIEIWQANAAGRYHDTQDRRDHLPIDHAFLGFGRVPTDADGIFRFETIRPGAVPGPGNALQAPHVAVGVLGRGLLKRLVTRLYFSDQPENDDDHVLATVPADRRATLIAIRQPGIPVAYRFDLALQGDRETVFFDV